MISRLAVSALAFSIVLGGRAMAEGQSDQAAQNAQNKQMNQAYDQQQMRNRLNNGQSTAADVKAREKAQAAADKAEAVEKMKENLASIKDLWQKEEDAWKKSQAAMMVDTDPNKQPFVLKDSPDFPSCDYADVGLIAQSVAMANVLGSEDLADQARSRLQDLEDIAKKLIARAEDLEIRQDWTNEAATLLCVLTQLKVTKSVDVAQQRFTSLRSKPEVAAFETLKKAEDLEAVPNLTEAIKIYEELSTNPRFENTIPALIAKRKIAALNADDQTRAKIKQEMDAKAAKEAPQMFSTAKNFVANNMPKDAIAKLEQIIIKFPNTTYADEAKKMIDGLK